MKKLLTVFLALMLVITVMPIGVISVSAEKNPDFEYSISDGKATITKYIGDETSITIPSTLDNYPVTCIGKNAFSKCWTMTGVIIPDSITSIGDYAFSNCYYLLSITIPSSVTIIGYEAFTSCNSLSRINVDENNTAYTSLNGVLFDEAMQELIQYPIQNEASEYTIPDGVKTIDDGAFGDCSNLTSVIIPNSVINIGNNTISDSKNGAFENCSGLTSITIPDSVKNIYNLAFYNCINLTEVVIPDGLTTINYGVFFYCTSLSSVIIPDSVTSIKSNAFNNCSSLTSITIPGSVTSIEGLAFSSCTGLQSLTVKSSATSIGSFAFSICRNLSTVVFDGNAPDKVGAYVFSGCSNSLKIYYKKGTTGWTNPWNGYTTKEIDPNVLHTVTYNTNGATSGSAPVDSKTYVYDSAVTVMGNTGNMEKPTYEFKGWNTKEDGKGNNYTANNTFIMGPEDVVLYADWYRDETRGEPQKWENAGITWDYTPLGTNICIVNGCNLSAGDLIIPDSINGRQVITISYRAFSYNELTGVTIPDSVTNIGQSAFSDCTKLTQINVDSNNPSYSSKDGVLFNKDKTTLIQYPCGKTGSYKIPSGVTSIYDNAFLCCSELTEVTIPDSVTEGNAFMFVCCTKLTQINVDDNNTKFTSEDGVLFNKAKTALFQYPGGKTGSYTIPSSVTAIGVLAFYNCIHLTSVTIPSNVVCIYNNEFSNCTKLTQIIVDDKNATYSSEDGVLFDKTKKALLQFPGGKTGSYTIPNGVTDIGPSAFEGCSELTGVTFPNSITDINSRGFCGCTGLTNVNIPTGVKDIGLQVFSGCTGLTDVNIPTGVKDIGSQAFSGCTELTNVNIPTSVTCIGAQAFSGCTGLTGLIIPNSIMVIDYGAFFGCMGLTSLNIPDSVEYIGSQVFSGCTGLKSVTIPESVTNIGLQAFYGCDQLAEIRGKTGSYANEYADSNGIPFINFEYFYGDVNDDGVITASDALMVLQASVKKINLDNETAVVANGDGDGDVDAADALLILRYAVGKINKFPVES